MYINDKTMPELNPFTIQSKAENTTYDKVIEEREKKEK